MKRIFSKKLLWSFFRHEPEGSVRQEKKHKSLNNPSFNQVEEVRKPRMVAAAVPETSLGAKTPFTKSYTVRELDHLEIYAFFYKQNNLANIVPPIKKCTELVGGILCAYPVQKVGTN